MIPRAKNHGINISAITEEFLRAVTYDYFIRAHGKILVGYLALFEAFRPVVEKYKLVVEVGQSSVTNVSGKVRIDRSFLSHEVKLPNLLTDTGIFEVAQEVFLLYSPRKVLENLIEAVIKRSQEDKLKLQDLEVSLKLVKAIFSIED